MSITKKIFIASLIIFLTVLLFWGIYILSFKKADENIVTDLPETENKKEGISFSLGDKINVLSEEKMAFPSLSPDNSSVQYYSPETGKISQISLEGKTGTDLSSRSWPGLLGVFWSPERNKAIFKSAGTNGQPSFVYFDANAIKETHLKDNLDMVVWQNDGKILYKYYNPVNKERSLNIADPDGNNWKKITDLEFKNVFIAPVPKTGFITYWNQSSAQEETQMISVSITGGDKKTLFSGKFGADYLWNNSGSKILVNHSDTKGGGKMEIATLDSQGGNYRNLEIPGFLSKCVWSFDDKTLYYALPGNIPAGSVLPDDYKAGKFNTQDTFWKIDIASGKKERLVSLDKIKEQIDAKDLFLSRDESYLFFINKLNGKLYRITL